MSFFAANLQEALGTLKVAVEFKRQGKQDKALRLFDHALALAPKHPAVLTKYGEFLEHHRRDVIRADLMYFQVCWSFGMLNIIYNLVCPKILGAHRQSSVHRCADQSSTYRKHCRHTRPTAAGQIGRQTRCTVGNTRIKCGTASRKKRGLLSEHLPFGWHRR